MPWKTILKRRLAGGLCAFNSATAVMPWKTAMPFLIPAGRSSLQFGHGCDAVENSNFSPFGPRISFLQFGHGCDAVENTQLEGLAQKYERLQFGHGCDAVENGWGGGRRTQPLRTFNSATAVMPWKT